MSYSRGNFHFYFANERSTEVELQILSISGKSIKKLKIDSQTFGEHQIVIPANTLPKVIYIWKLNTDGYPAVEIVAIPGY